MRARSSFCGASFCVLALGAGSSLAAAQATPSSSVATPSSSVATPLPPTPSSSAQSSSTQPPSTQSLPPGELYRKALADYRSGRHADAWKGFSELWRLEKKPKTAGNLGRTELALKMYRDAAEHLSFFLREQLGLPDEDRKEVTALLDEAKRHVGTLRVAVSPSGAVVSIDGAAAHRAPLAPEVYVEPGRRRVEARMGQRRAVKELDVQAGAVIAFTLEVPPLARDPARGSTTWADRAWRDPSPSPSGGPADASRAPSVPVILLVAGAGLVVAGGAMMGAGALQKSEATAQAPRTASGAPLCSRRGPGFDQPGGAGCDDIRGMTSTADTLWAAGTGTAIAGGALALGATLLWILPGERTTTTASTRVLPAVGKDGAGLVWQGSF